MGTPELILGTHSRMKSIWVWLGLMSKLQPNFSSRFTPSMNPGERVRPRGSLSNSMMRRMPRTEGCSSRILTSIDSTRLPHSTGAIGMIALMRGSRLCSLSTNSISSMYWPPPEVGVTFEENHRLDIELAAVPPVVFDVVGVAEKLASLESRVFEPGLVPDMQMRVDDWEVRHQRVSLKTGLSVRPKPG